MEKISIELLKKIFTESLLDSEGVDATNFRAKNYKYINELEDLERKNYLENRYGRYHIKILALKEISVGARKAKSLLILCQKIFSKLRGHYKKNPGSFIKIRDLANLCDVPKEKIIHSLSYMIDTQIFGGYSTDLKVEDASVTPSESILKYKSFEHVIETLENWQKHDIFASTSTVIDDLGSKIQRDRHPYYVDRSRIEELRKLQNGSFDLKRIVRICEELNSSFENSNFFATACLVRTILDHVPPIFKFRSFKEVANNYDCGKSIKKSFMNLENSSRNIADSLLHQQIRKCETLPTRVTVNFTHDLDMLLSEIVRIFTIETK